MPKFGFDTDIYNNDGTTWYGGDSTLDMGFTITVQSNKLVGQFQASGNGATLDNGDLILPFNILGLTQTINKQTPDDGMAVGDSITTYNGQMSGSVALYVVPAPEPDITPKAVSLDNLQTFKGKCDETYAPMSRALPAPAGTTDAGKVPTVNNAGNGYTLQTPSGGGGSIIKLTLDGNNISTTAYVNLLLPTNNVNSYDDLISYLDVQDPGYVFIPACGSVTQNSNQDIDYKVDGFCFSSAGNPVVRYFTGISTFAQQVYTNCARFAVYKL